MTPTPDASASSETRAFPGRAFLLFACLYILSIGHGFYSSDGEVMFKTAAALAERQSFALSPDPGLPQIVRGHDSRSYSKYDPGLPILLVPLYTLGDGIAHINHAHRYRLAAIFALLLPALAGAVTLAALVTLVESLPQRHRCPDRNTPLTHDLIILAAGIASPLWFYARVLFAEALLAGALTLTVSLLVRGGRTSPRRNLVAGLIFGVGILTRAAFVVYLPALLVLVAGQPGRARVARLAWFGIGLLPFVAGLLAHNLLRFDDPLRFGYAGEAFTTAPGQGIAGLLLSPGKSVFVYAPPLLLSLILWPRFRREYPALGSSLALAWISALIVYGSWWAWHGGWSWGPRFLVPLIPLSMLPLVALPDGRRWRAALVALIVLGALIELAGVLTDPTPHYASLTENGVTNFDAAHLDPRHSPLVAAFRRLWHGQTEPLAVFHLHETGLPPTWTIGVPVLLLAAVITLTARYTGYHWNRITDTTT